MGTRYERYIHTDDEQLFRHLKTIGPCDEVYAECVPQLLKSQLQGMSLYPTTWCPKAD